MMDIYYTEDDQQIAGIVKEYLERLDYKVSIFETMEETKAALKRHLPSVILVDWNLPDGDGDWLCRWIRSRWQTLPIIFLTVRGDSRDIVSGFQNGADDYVVKPFELEVLTSRIAALLRRSGKGASRYLSCGTVTLDQERRAVRCGLEEIRLSPLEYQLLLHLMQKKGSVVTRQSLLENIWDVTGNFVNDNTLTVTMKRLREKLPKPSCIRTVRSAGYCMEEEE